jgi:short-subunit dehydrogenase
MKFRPSLSFTWLIWPQTVLLTGGSEGMGRSVAHILAQKGANIAIVSRSVRKLEEALEHMKVRCFSYLS